MEEHHYYGKSSSTSSNNNNNHNGRNLNFSNQALFEATNVGEVPNNESMDNLLDDLLQNTQTNNYLHQLHNEIFTPQEERSSETDNNSTQLVAEKSSSNSKKRGRSERGDNKEAVRKYREKLKAREALLEDEIKNLKAANEELSKKLEGEAAMQAEVCWLKCLLVDIRGRIEGETCSFRFYKSFNNGTSFRGHDNLMNQCNGHHGSDGKFTIKRRKFYDQGSNNVGETDNINCTPSLGSKPKQFLSFSREV